VLALINKFRPSVVVRLPTFFVGSLPYLLCPLTSAWAQSNADSSAVFARRLPFELSDLSNPAETSRGKL